jgi:protein TonB
MKAVFYILMLVFAMNCKKVFAQEDVLHVPEDSLICISHDTVVYVNVEKNAIFNGGDIIEFRNFVAKNIKFPIEALKDNTAHGKVYVEFIVNWDGKVRNVKVYKSSGHKTLDKEAVRVVKISPVWIPARNNNICVSQRFVIPIVFRKLGNKY